MDKNKEEELKATQEMAGGGFDSFYIVMGAFFTVILGALILKHPSVTWTGVGQGVLVMASCFVAANAFFYLLDTLYDNGFLRTPAAIIKDIKSVFRRTSKESNQKGEKTEIIDVNPNSIHLTDKKQAEAEAKAPLSETKPDALEEVYANAVAKNQDNKQPSNTAKEDKTIRTCQP